MFAEQKRVASPDSLAGEIPNPKRIQTDDELAEVEISACTSDIPEEFMIEELVDKESFQVLANQVSGDGEIVHILEEFLETLTDDSPHTLQTRALKHFYQAKKIWQNHRFIGVLVKDLEGFMPCSMPRYNHVATRKLSDFLLRKIRSDPSFEDVFKYKERDNSMMRSALSIWIGYWSNEYMTFLLVDLMGYRALGLNHSGSKDVNAKKTHFASGAFPAVEEDMTVCSSIIADLRQDDSIKALAEQLLKNPKAVKMAEELLMSLQDDALVGRSDRYEYHVRHRNAAARFWYDPLIVVQLSKALKESIQLVNILKKCSKGAQRLLCVERVTRIQREPLLGPILKGDRALKIRGALSILFGFWGEIDLTMLLSTICGAQEAKETIFEFDVSNDKFEVFSYLAVDQDVEGLKKVLGDKYREDSIEYMDRYSKIMAKQESEEANQKREEASESDYEYEAIIRSIVVLLKNGEVIFIKMDRRNVGRITRPS